MTTRFIAGAIVLWLVAGCATFVMPPTPQPASNLALDAVSPPGLPNGVAAGDVTQESVVLWARASEPGLVTFTVQTDSGATMGMPLTRTVVEPLLPVTVSVTGLTPNTAYTYQAAVTNGDIATGRFRTPAAEGVHRGLRFAATGDVRGDLAPYPALTGIAGHELDFFVHLGDTIYADIGSPAVPRRAQTEEEFRLKHDEVHRAARGLNTLAALRAATITFATVDDHEIVNNFAGGAPAGSGVFAGETGLVNETRLYQAGMDAFLAYQPLAIERYGAGADARMVGRPKLYRYRTFGADAALFVLDMRSFRDAQLPRVTNLDDDATLASFARAAFDPTRTLLGSTQMAALQRDLRDAQARGITWKFVVIPDPIQYLDMTAATDRWQGYAAERTALLRFIAETPITNVVFITADIHGTVVNNLTYQTEADGPQLPVAAWEIAVGPVAAHPPFGLAMYLTYQSWGLLTAADEETYAALPVRHDMDDAPDDRDDFMRALINAQMARFGFNPIGLADAAAGEAASGAAIEAELVAGDYMAGHVYGWSEFAIDAATQTLTVTTYGVPMYVAAEMAATPAELLARTPEIVSEFVVRPAP